MVTQEMQALGESENIFRNIEVIGERLKQEMKEMSLKAQKIMDNQIDTSKFEAAYALSVSKKQRIKTREEVKEVRKSLWEEALKKTNGNINDACEMYEKLCAFP